MKLVFIAFLLCFVSSYFLKAQVNYNFPERAVYDNQNNRYLISNTGNGNIINGNLNYFNQGGYDSGIYFYRL